MSKFSGSQKRNSLPAPPPHHHSPSLLPGQDLLYLSSTDWLSDLSLGPPYAQDPAPPSLAPASPQPLMSQPTSLIPLSQSSQLHAFPDIPAATFEHGNYLAVNAQLPWSSDSLMVPPLYHDMSSQGSSPSARLSSETPSFQDADTPMAAEQQQPPKKPKRSRPNRYKNAPPAVIQRRRAANRKSQRAYRKRKDDRIAELEELLREAAEREHDMGRAYAKLRAEYEQQLLTGGGGSSGNRHHGRSPSAAVAAASEDEDAAVTMAPTFLALPVLAQQQGGDGSLIAPQLLHPQQSQQQLRLSSHLLPIYPPAPI